MAPKKKSHFSKLKLDVDVKYTSFGTTCESVLEKERENREAITWMYTEIADTVQKVSSNLKALVNHPFYLVHANYYIEYRAEKRNIPCEVAIVEYCLADGIRRVLHFYPPVDAPNGLLPSGYRAHCVEHSESTHALPEPPFEAARTDFKELSLEVLDFLTQGGQTDIPPVYTMPDHEPVNYSKTTVFDFFETVQDFTEKCVKVYELPILAFELYNTCLRFGKGFGPQSEESFKAELIRDKYLYTPGISCIFHETLGNVQFCSQSTVSRWAFIISEFCSKTVQVELIPGKHCPDKNFTRQESTEEKEQKRSTKAPKELPPRLTSSRSVKKVTQYQPGAAFQRDEPEGDTRIYKVGKDPTVVSEIRMEKTNPLVAGTGVRLPKTRGRGDKLMSDHLNQPLEGFTKDDFPALGGGGRGRVLKK